MKDIFKKIDTWIKQHSSVPTAEKLFFVQNLQVMTKAGLSLSKALKTLSLQTKNKYFQEVLANIQTEIEKGVELSQAMRAYPNVFNELFVNMIASGEVSGNLENVLQSLYLQLKKEHDLISKVRGAMIYPSVIIIAMIGIGTFMMMVVVPRIVSIFEEIKTELPLPTRILIAVSDFASSYSLVIISTGVILAFATAKFMRTERGKLVFHWIWLRAPVIKHISQKINLARFARTLSSLLQTDVSIVEAIQITSKTLGNVYYRKALLSFADNLKKGDQINTVMTQFPNLFPPLIVQMTLVGEESGSLDDILKEIAQFYEADVDQTMENLPSLIEPILILLLGVGVAGIAVSILLPLFNLTQAI